MPGVTVPNMPTFARGQRLAAADLTTLANAIKALEARVNAATGLSGGAAGIVTVRNNTATAYSTGEAIFLSSQLHSYPALERAPLLDGSDFTTSADFTRFGIVLDVIAPAMTGRVAISGALTVTLDGVGTGSYATPVVGQRTMQLADSGAPVVWTSSDGLTAVIMLGGTGGGSGLNWEFLEHSGS